MTVVCILADSYTLGFNLSSLSEFIICPINGLILSYPAHRSIYVNCVIFAHIIQLIFRFNTKTIERFNFSNSHLGRRHRYVCYLYVRQT